MISVVINTKNEEGNIARAIRSVEGFADDILVADMNSSDNTPAIARTLGARVITVPDFGFVEPARELAVEAALHDWILILDADEVLRPTLAGRLEEIASAGRPLTVRVHMMTFMFGTEIAHSGWSSARELHMRFFHRSVADFRPRIHTEPVARTGAEVITLPDQPEMCLIHFNYTDWSHFLAKLDRYTTVEAIHALEDPGNVSVPRTSEAIRVFVSRYFRDSGWRNGRQGLLLSLLMLCYHLLVAEKAKLRITHGTTESILAEYDSQASAFQNGS